MEPSCYSGWDTYLAPLLQPRTDCQASMPAIWNGSACSVAQYTRRKCYDSACDLWCGLLSDVHAAGGVVAQSKQLVCIVAFVVLCCGICCLCILKLAPNAAAM